MAAYGLSLFWKMLQSYRILRECWANLESISLLFLRKVAKSRTLKWKQSINMFRTWIHMTEALAHSTGPAVGDPFRTPEFVGQLKGKRSFRGFQTISGQKISQFFSQLWVFVEDEAVMRRQAQCRTTPSWITQFVNLRRNYEYWLRSMNQTHCDGPRDAWARRVPKTFENAIFCTHFI